MAVPIVAKTFGRSATGVSGRFNEIAAGVFFLGMSFGVKHVAILGAVPPLGNSEVVSWSPCHYER